MASLLTPDRTDTSRPAATSRTRTSLRLRVARLTDRRQGRPREEPSGPPLGWLPVAAVCGAGWAAVGWVLAVGLVVGGWLSAEPGTLAEAIVLGTKAWLLGNGVSVRIGALPVTLIPWAGTALVVYGLHRSGRTAARLVRPEQTVGAGLVSVVVVTSYLIPVLAVAAFLGEPWNAPDLWAAVIAVLALATYWGARHGFGQSLLNGAGAWWSAIPRAVLGTQLVLIGVGAVLLVTSLLLQLSRVSELQQALAPNLVGLIALWIGQAAFAPNLFVWAASYALGAGFRLGPDSVVTPAASELGLLPGLPIFGALPVAGPGGVHQLWWLAGGVLAGALAAWLVVRARPQARLDETSLVGGLCGLLGGVIFVAVAWATSGDLGVDRLAGLGPRLLPLLVMGTTTMGLSGTLTGLVLGLVRRRRTARVDPS